MKKIIALLTVAVLALSLAACGSKGGDDKKTSAASEGKETLTMATNATFPPYEYYDDDNNIAGIDVDIANAIAEKLGMELEIQDIDFDAIVTSVQSGKADIGLAGMTVDPDRAKNVNFTDSYATGVQVIIVKDDSDITGPDSLEGKKIGVQQGTTGDIYCSDDYGDENVVKYTNGPNAVEALKTGKVDCVVIDNEPAKEYVKANEGLKIVDTEYVQEEYAAIVAKDNEELYQKVNTAIKELKEDGTIQKILDKYIKSE